MLLLVGVETLQNIPEKSDKASLIRLYFSVADIWCCLGGGWSTLGEKG